MRRDSSHALNLARPFDPQSAVNSVSVAFVIPCYNEALTVAQVVADCQAAMPEAAIYVFDNNSSDETSRIAKDAGATVIRSPRPGKGEVVRHAFRLLHEDVVVLLDGDGTYDASRAPEMVRLLVEQEVDMIVCNRVTKEVSTDARAPYPKFHVFGNRMFSGFIGFLLGQPVSDVFSGYRAVSRRFFESVAFESRGFEVESELTLKAASYGFEVRELEGVYGARPSGSHSKLKTFSDGWRILLFVVSIMRDCRPLFFFGCASLVAFVLSLWSGVAPIRDYIDFHYVYTLPRAVLAASLMILAVLSLTVGVILDAQKRMLRQQAQSLRLWLEKERARS